VFYQKVLFFGVPLSYQTVPSYEVPERHLKTWVPHGSIRGVVLLEEDLAPEMVPDDAFYSNSVRWDVGYK